MLPISHSTTLTACGFVRAIRIGCINRTIAAYTASTGRRTNGCASGETCRSASVTSDFRWRCTRATRIRHGCFRWTAPPLAAHLRGRHARCLRDTQWGKILVACRSRPARARRVVDREAPGDGRRRQRSRRTVLRYDERRPVVEPRRGPTMGLHRKAPAGNLRGGDGPAGLAQLLADA